MESFLLTAALGVIVIVLGVLNRKGNVSTLHRYHRKRVSEEDRLPFGRKVGSGTVIVGGALVLSAGLRFAAEKTDLPVMQTVGTVVLVIGFVVGFAIIVYAMIKYNKGIF